MLTVYEPCIISGKRGVKSLFNQPDVPAAATGIAGGASHLRPQVGAGASGFWKHLARQIVSPVLIDRSHMDHTIHITMNRWDFQSDKARLQELDLFAGNLSSWECPQCKFKSIYTYDFVRPKKKKHFSQTNWGQFNNIRSWIAMLSKSCLGQLSSWVCKGWLKRLL